MPRSVETVVVGDQEFSSPNIPIGTHPCTIEGHAYDRASSLVIGHTTGNMGVVMLHGNKLHTGIAGFTGIPGGQIIGVEVMRQ
jgi:hypothetical protein